MKKVLLILFIFMVLLSVQAQVTVAIVDFENQTNHFYLDAWSQRIPEFLRTELSKSDQLILVDRHNIKAILNEQKFSMTGLTDSSEVLEIGKMLSAQYIITGILHEYQGKYRIDASVIQVASGKMISEKVESQSEDALDKMVAMLGNNLRHKMTNEGEYKERILLRQYPIRPFLYSTLSLGIMSVVTNNLYQKKWDDYQDAVHLYDFDPMYDSANRFYRIRNVVFAATAVSAVTTLYCWLKSSAPDEILAGEKYFMPYALSTEKGGILVGFQISF